MNKYNIFIKIKIRKMINNNIIIIIFTPIIFLINPQYNYINNFSPKIITLKNVALFKP